MGPPVTASPSAQFWAGRRVLVTGHTGFKGAWLTCWLRELGADVLGVALPEPVSSPALWDLLALADVAELRADLTGGGWSDRVVAFAPEVVLHLAAQALVPAGHRDPGRTFETNVGGTVAVMRLLDRLPDLMAAVVVTSDKVYDPHQPPPYDETQLLGGDEPYSASKAAAELVVRSWPAGVPRGTARAGNVIGGGDWAAERLLPDLIRAWQSGAVPALRSPGSVRPWQHVLEPLRGYLVYAEALAAGREVPSALNFGPAEAAAVRVSDVVEHAASHWRQQTGTTVGFRVTSAPELHETAILTLDSRLAAESLGWAGILDWSQAVELTLDWHLLLAAGCDARSLVSRQLATYRDAVLTS